MAKDGTNRGGPRPGTGPKKKPLADKITEGKAKGTLVMPDDFPEPEHIEGEDIPPVREYLKARQKNGSDLCAEEIFQETYMWLKARGCEQLVNKQLIEQYAMSAWQDGYSARRRYPSSVIWQSIRQQAMPSLRLMYP